MVLDTTADDCAAARIFPAATAAFEGTLAVQPAGSAVAAQAQVRTADLSPYRASRAGTRSRCAAKAGRQQPDRVPHAHRGLHPRKAARTAGVRPVVRAGRGHRSTMDVQMRLGVEGPRSTAPKTTSTSTSDQASAAAPRDSSGRHHREARVSPGSAPPGSRQCGPPGLSSGDPGWRRGSRPTRAPLSGQRAQPGFPARLGNDSGDHRDRPNSTTATTTGRSDHVARRPLLTTGSTVAGMPLPSSAPMPVPDGQPSATGRSWSSQPLRAESSALVRETSAVTQTPYVGRAGPRSRQTRTFCSARPPKSAAMIGGYRPHHRRGLATVGEMGRRRNSSPSHWQRRRRRPGTVTD